MRVLVTGATGFLGGHLVQHLREADFEITLLVREAYGLGQSLPPPLAAMRQELHLVYADLRNYRLTSRALAEARPDIVFHLAAAGVTDPYLSVDKALRHNTVGTINLLRATFSKSPAARRLIVARTPGERLPTNPYQASKAAAWSFSVMYARQEQWPICGAMVFQAYGPGQPENTLIPSAMASALAGDNFPMTPGLQQRDWIYVDDVMAGLVAMASTDVPPGFTVELGTGEGTSVLDAVRQIYALVGRGGAPLPGKRLDRPGEEAYQVANSQSAREILGWRPTNTLEQGLRRLLEVTTGGHTNADSHAAFE